MASDGMMYVTIFMIGWGILKSCSVGITDGSDL
jgi:hypothetical protein